jgi:hypothetical protein
MRAKKCAEMGIIMPISEKEYNGYLFDQLTLLERLEIIAKRENAVETLAQIELERKAIERKLYQNPPLTDSSAN